MSFIRNITHELKTPLSAIIVGLSLLKATRPRPLCLIFWQECGRLSRSIDQILQLSKLEHAELSSSSVDLRGILEDIYRENLPLARLRGLIWRSMQMLYPSWERRPFGALR